MSSSVNIPSEIQVLHKVCQTLQDQGIRYMLTGSFAMHFHANPRMTQDIDIVIELTPADVTVLCKALGSEFYSDEDMAIQAIEDSSMFNVIFQRTGIKIDFIIRKNSSFAKEAFLRRKDIALLGKNISVATAEDLVISKLDWARDTHSEMQLRDVSNLLKIKTLDHYYIETWVDKLDLKELYAKAKSY